MCEVYSIGTISRSFSVLFPFVLSFQVSSALRKFMSEGLSRVWWAQKKRNKVSTQIICLLSLYPAQLTSIARE
jgi:predicted ABC-type exoprotein transport system permease subunit